MKTTINMNGLRIEHNGGNSVLLVSEAPSKVGIEDLIAELTSLLPRSAEGEKSRPLRQGSLCSLPAKSSRIAGIG